MVSGHKHRGTYKRKVQDLPILGKTTYLLVNAHEYQCENPSCAITTFAENVNGFFKPYDGASRSFYMYFGIGNKL